MAYTMTSALITTPAKTGTASRSPFAGGRSLVMPARPCTPAAARCSVVVKALFTRNKTDVRHHFYDWLHNWSVLVLKHGNVPDDSTVAGFGDAQSLGFWQLVYYQQPSM